MTVAKFPKGRVLTALNAEVTTATIAITTMVIDRRQVTLSVFRQMVEEPIFDWEKMALRGVGWGWVNYKVDQHPGEAINLVFQRGNDLYRCVVQRKAPRYDDAKRNHFLNHLWNTQLNGPWDTLDSFSGETVALDKWNSYMETPLGTARPAGVEVERSFPKFNRDQFSGPRPKYETTDDLLRAVDAAGGFLDDWALAPLKAPEDLALALLENRDLVVAARARNNKVFYGDRWRTVAGWEWQAKKEAHDERQTALARAHEEQRQTDIKAYRDEVRAEYVAWLDAWERRYDEYDALVAPLFDLPHLYIAV